MSGKSELLKLMSVTISIISKFSSETGICVSSVYSKSRRRIFRSGLSRYATSRI